MRGLLLDFGGVLDAPGSLRGIVADLRRRGIATAVVSNDPGGPSAEPIRALACRVVDAVVLSGDVGIRKPDPGIYVRAAREIGVAPHECVFVDDLRSNVLGAVAVGMVGVHHVDVDSTIEELRILFHARQEDRPVTDGAGGGHGGSAGALPAEREQGDTWTRD